MFANSGPSRETKPRWPLVRRSWYPAVIYAYGYTLSLMMASVGMALAAGFNTPRLRLSGPLLEPGWFALAGLIPFVYCQLVPGLSARWRAKVVERRTAYWHVFAVAATGGALIGAAYFGFAVFPNRAVQEIGALFLFLGGPLHGIWWLVRDKPRPGAEDYDDVMPDRQPSGEPIRIDLPDLAATETFGHRLGGLLFPNAVVALVGPLGAGKTQLTRAVAEGLGIANPAAVTSPTFTLVHEYPARLPIYHFDAYRLNGPNEFLDLGVSEYYEAGGVCLIEWADKVESALPAERLTIRLTPVDEHRRVAEVVGTGEKYQALASALRDGDAPNQAAVPGGSGSK